MTHLDFGKQLRIFRQQTLNPKTEKQLTQQKLGELLGEEMGDYGFSGAAVSDWERSKSKINVNDRPVLVNLIRILKRHGGIQTLADANLLLETGNYRALNTSEKDKIFSEEIQEAGHPPSTPLPQEQVPSLKFVLSNVFFNSPVGFQKLLDEANEGPPPAWPRVAVALTNRITSQWSVFHVLRILIWFWVWLITYTLISPSLRWPFASQENALRVMILYAAGTVILPFVIGAMIDIKNNSFWKEQKIPSVLMTLYIYQGASIGFHLGYFVVFALSLAQYYFQLQLVVWIELIKMVIPIAVGYAGAQLVPYNLWLAYGRLHLKDGGIFFVFVILGPAWAWFFLKFYETLISQKPGAIIILISITTLTGAMALQYRRKKNTTIPVHWWIILYSLILIGQVILIFIK